MTQTLVEHKGARAFNPVAEGGYGWLWIVFNVLVFSAAAICWPPETTRALTARDERVARRTFLFSVPGQFVRLAVPVLWAVAAFCLVTQNTELAGYFYPDGLSGAPQHAGEAMPLVLGKVVPTGLLGLLVAGLLAAFMSTHDSYLLCWSGVIARDVVSPLRGGLSAAGEIRVTRISLVVIGIFLLVWGLWYKPPTSIWTYMAVTGTVYLSGAATAIVGGLYWKRASTAGAVAALLGGLIAIVGIFAEQHKMAISNIQIAIGTFILCIVLFVVFSLLIPDKPREAIA
jgi:SSS family solute:Na+ symporter